MNTPAEFIMKCQEAIRRHKAGDWSLKRAAVAIAPSRYHDYPFDTSAHPMLYYVADLAFAIADDFDPDDRPGSNADNWQLLVEIINDYVSGNWHSTCWMLSATYGKYTSNKIVHSYGVVMRRQNGETHIQTSNNDINRAISDVVRTLNMRQTDERYLQNAAKLMPGRINEYTLLSVDVEEHLVS
ncbi:MAG TPA: hypothetical protein VLA88_02765 [Candidatus Saccharimonadales bacterium]|nr:hypothetical protein [Candidatus Saccharimonadales bacterium]